MRFTIFYDRKHNCEIRHDQLCFTHCVVDLARVDETDPTTNTGCHELVIGELGYLPDNASDWDRKHRNWARHLMYTDLVFLRFEDDYE
jgi:hypothetical protein